MNSKKIISWAVAFSAVATISMTSCSDSNEPSIPESSANSVTNESSESEIESTTEETEITTKSNAKDYIDPALNSSLQAVLDEFSSDLTETTAVTTDIDEENQEFKFAKDFVGDSIVGYINLKDSGEWVDFHEAEETGALSMQQVSRKDMSSIITMAAYETELSPEEVGQNTAAGMQTQGAEGVTGAKVEVGVDNLPAIQVYGFYPADEIFLVTWLFNVPEDNYVHYISAEFPAEDNITVLMDTFSMKEPE